MFEIYDLLFENQTKLPEIALKLGIEQHEGIIIYSTIQVLVISAQIIIIRNEMREAHEGNISDDVRLKNEAQYKELKVKFRNALMVLYMRRIISYKRRTTFKYKPRIALWNKVLKEKDMMYLFLDPEADQDQILGNIYQDLNEVIKSKPDEDIPFIEEIYDGLRMVDISRDKVKYIKSIAGVVIHNLE